jgi:hypothetical protein
MALRVLGEWPPDFWPTGARETIEAIAWRDPEDKVKKRARDVLEGQATE